MESEELFKEIKKFLKQKGWKEQTCGEIYINGELATNFWNGNETIHISLNLWADEEILERIKQ